MKKILKAFIFILTVLLFLQCSAEKLLLPDTELKPDKEITIGTLDNGMKYYIRSNSKPEKRAELRLVVNAGSILENDKQQGLAHFAEHMAFNGTKHFKSNDIIEYLESIGMRFGPDLNASTGFDETVYKLKVPTDSDEVLEKAFLILEDWAFNVSYISDEIEKERGVVIEEWRQGRGPDARVRDKHLKVLFDSSHYAERLPIGDIDIIKNFKPQTMIDFYKTWYRPELMSVVAVGDFDKDKIEELVKKHFSSYKNPENKEERQLYEIPDNKGVLFSIASDSELSSSSLSIFYKHDIPETGKVKNYVDDIKASLFSFMLNQRFSELKRNQDPPFLYAYSGDQRLVRTKAAFAVSSGLRDNDFKRSFETILYEIKRVKDHGFEAAEFERAKKSLFSMMEQYYNERNKAETISYAEEYKRNYLYNESIPGIETEFNIYKKYLDKIKLDDVNNLADKWIKKDNTVVLLSLPDKKGARIPDESELAEIMKKVESRETEKRLEKTSENILETLKTKSGKIEKEELLKTNGIKKLELSNGAVVYLKNTDFKDDEILFTAFSSGGYSLASDADFIAAKTSADIVDLSGLKGISLTDLEKILSGKVAGVSPYVDRMKSGFSGSSSIRDMEDLFKLIYLYFNNPEKDEEAFESYKTRMKDKLANRLKDPGSYFFDKLNSVMYSNNKRARPMEISDIRKMNLDKSFDFYKERFKNAGNFTFVFVGSFREKEIYPFIEKYIASLPADSSQKENWRDNNIRLSDKTIIKTIKKGKEQQSMVALVFGGPYEWSRENNYSVNAISEVLDIKLREVIRESLGGTYNISVFPIVKHYPEPEYKIIIYFSCDPDKVESLVNRVFVELDKYKKSGLDKSYYEKVKALQIKDYETSLENNGFWLNSIESLLFDSRDLNDILNYREFVESIKMEDIEKKASFFLDNESYIQLIMLPE